MRDLTSNAPDRRELLICKCGDVSHHAVVFYDDDGEVYLDVFLTPTYGFWKRLWNALRYVCGKRSVYGDFDEIILSYQDADALGRVVDFLRAQKH